MWSIKSIKRLHRFFFDATWMNCTENCSFFCLILSLSLFGWIARSTFADEFYLEFWNHYCTHKILNEIFSTCKNMIWWIFKWVRMKNKPHKHPLNPWIEQIEYSYVLLSKWIALHWKVFPSDSLEIQLQYALDYPMN